MLRVLPGCIYLFSFGIPVTRSGSIRAQPPLARVFTNPTANLFSKVIDEKRVRVQ